MAPGYGDQRNCRTNTHKQISLNIGPFGLRRRGDAVDRIGQRYGKLKSHPVVALKFLHQAAEPERTQQLYERMATVNPGFAEYQHQTTRIIPVIVLTRIP
jgi:hypothetical protein